MAEESMRASRCPSWSRNEGAGGGGGGKAIGSARRSAAGRRDCQLSQEQFPGEMRTKIRTPDGLSCYARLMAGRAQRRSAPRVGVGGIRRNASHLLELPTPSSISRRSKGQDDGESIAGDGRSFSDVVTMIRPRREEEDSDLAVGRRGPMPREMAGDPLRRACASDSVNLSATRSRFPEVGEEGVSIRMRSVARLRLP